MAITPASDQPLQKLLLYLKTEMNAESQLYTGKNAVEGTREFQTDLNAVDRFPLLMGYRSRYRGHSLERCDLTIEWFIRNPVEIEDQPGYLNWGVRTLGRLLANTEDQPTPCLQIEPSNITGEIRFGQVGGGLYVPFVRIEVTDVIDLD